MEADETQGVKNSENDRWTRQSNMKEEEWLDSNQEFCRDGSREGMGTEGDLLIGKGSRT